MNLSMYMYSDFVLVKKDSITAMVRTALLTCKGLNLRSGGIIIMFLMRMYVFTRIYILEEIKSVLT